MFKALIFGVFGKTVNDCIIPIALSILILFFMINLIRRSMEVEKISWEKNCNVFCAFSNIEILDSERIYLSIKYYECCK